MQQPFEIYIEYNYISFQIWGNFDESISLIYSPYEEPDVSRINANSQTIESINQDGWFYYREMIER